MCPWASSTAETNHGSTFTIPWEPRATAGTQIYCVFLFFLISIFWMFSVAPSVILSSWLGRARPPTVSGRFGLFQKCFCLFMCSTKISCRPNSALGKWIRTAEDFYFWCVWLLQEFSARVNYSRFHPPAAASSQGWCVPLNLDSSLSVCIWNCWFPPPDSSDRRLSEVRHAQQKTLVFSFLPFVVLSSTLSKQVNETLLRTLTANCGSLMFWICVYQLQLLYAAG